MEEQNRTTISSLEAARMLTSRNEDGQYMIGSFNGPEERANLTKVVEILGQVDLSKGDPEGFKQLRRALGIIGAHDKYGYMNQQNMIRSLSEFSEKCKLGDMTPARMYVNKFFGNMDAFSRSQIDDKFSDSMQVWLQASQRMLSKSEISMENLTRSALKETIRNIRDS